MAAPGPDVVELLQAGGLLIESLETEAFASGLRLRSGDVLIAWNGEPVVAFCWSRWFLAVVVGVLTGFGSVGFIYVIESARGLVAAFERFGAAQLVLLPALGGLLVGPLVERFAREAKGHGVPEVLAKRGGIIHKRVVSVKDTLRLHQRGIPFPYVTDGEQPAAKPAARTSPEIAGV